MRNIIITIILGIIVVLCTSCNTLEKELPTHELVGATAIVDEQTALTALNGVYAYLQYDYAQSSIFTPAFSYEYSVAGALMGGLLMGGQRYTFDRALRTFTVPETDNILPNFYKLLYRIVNAANNVIYYTELLPETKISIDKKAEIIAEARFLRGFAHFWFMKIHCYFWDINSIYGPILRHEPTSIKNLIIPRSTVREGYESVLADYDNCIEFGPEKHTSVFKICRTAAKAFKAEALMMRGEGSDFANALILTNEVITSADFSFGDYLYQCFPSVK